MAEAEVPDNVLGLYFDLKKNEAIDLEVAALAAVEWARAVRAAAFAADPNFDYRVTLLAAEPGSSRWITRIEQSKINQLTKDAKDRWDAVPLILQVALGLLVGLAVTGYPTYELYFGDSAFSHKQMEQLQEIIGKIHKDPETVSHRKSMYRELQKDNKIKAIGSGVPDSKGWKPPLLIPSNRFAEAEGLFEPQDPQNERTIYKTLDVILVTPHLQNVQRSWEFRQEGLPGTFKAKMKDAKFLSGLEKRGIHEELRTNIPMRIKLETKEQLIDGNWKVKHRGRSVVEVISPRPD